EALFDIRHDHQPVDDGVGRLGGNDAGLGDADVVIVAAALLGVGDGGAFHRPLHRARAATGADVHAAQAELVAHGLGVVILVARDGMTAPADHQAGIDTRTHHARVAKNLEDGVGDAGGRCEVESTVAVHLVGDVGDVTHYRHQQFGDTTNDFAIDKGHRRRVAQVKTDTSVLLQHLDVEIRVQLAGRTRIVVVAAGSQH